MFHTAIRKRGTATREGRAASYAACTTRIRPTENAYRRSDGGQQETLRAHGPTKVNCRSSVRCTAEKLSSEIIVNTVSPAGVW